MRLTLLALPLLAAACFKPTFDAPTCDPGGECPDGLMCIDGVCQEEPVDPPDAMPGDCDYEEVDETGNDTTHEATGIVIGAGQTRLCGVVVDRTPDANNTIDLDLYEIDTGGQPVTARVTVPGGSDYEEVLFALGGFIQTVSGEEATATSHFANPALQVAVLAGNPSALGHETPYVIVIERADPQTVCAVADAPMFVESLDTAANMNTGNDVFDNPFGSPSLTPDIADVPEQPPASLDIQSGAKLKFGGTGVNTAVHADMYKDRDTFVITTGAQTTSLTLALSWPEDSGTTADDADLDVFLYTETDFTVLYQGALFGYANYESGRADVTPGTRYYATVASYMDAQADKAYELVICGDLP